MSKRSFNESRQSQGKYRSRTEKIVGIASNAAAEFPQQVSQKARPANDFVFPGDRKGRHLSPRTAQRAMERAVKMAGITKPATCHSLRHSFAVHLIENGTDIRFIERLLGHAKLETTVIYTQVAQRTTESVQSPLDRTHKNNSPMTTPAKPNTPPVGRLTLHVQPIGPDAANVHVKICQRPKDVELDGIILKQSRAGWFSLELPALESWRPVLERLSRAQRDRVESAEFYTHLHALAVERYLYVKNSS